MRFHFLVQHVISGTKRKNARTLKSQLPLGTTGVSPQHSGKKQLRGTCASYHDAGMREHHSSLNCSSKYVGGGVLTSLPMGIGESAVSLLNILTLADRLRVIGQSPWVGTCDLWVGS